MCRPITLLFEVEGRRIVAKLVPLPARIAIPLNYSGSRNLYFPKGEILGAMMDASIVELEVDGEKIEWRKLPLPLQHIVFNLIATLNGLTPEGFELIQEKLRRLKENTKAVLEKREPPHETEVWMLLAKAAYAAMRAGLPFSKDHMIDEPYLLLLAVNVIAEAENEYYESISAGAQTQSSLQHIPTFPPELRERGEEGVRDYMLEVFRQITGTSLGISR